MLPETPENKMKMETTEHKYSYVQLQSLGPF